MKIPARDCRFERYIWSHTISPASASLPIRKSLQVLDYDGCRLAINRTVEPIQAGGRANPDVDRLGMHLARSVELVLVWSAPVGVIYVQRIHLGLMIDTGLLRVMSAQFDQLHCIDLQRRKTIRTIRTAHHIRSQPIRPNRPGNGTSCR